MMYYIIVIQPVLLIYTDYISVLTYRIQYVRTKTFTLKMMLKTWHL